MLNRDTYVDLNFCSFSMFKFSSFDIPLLLYLQRWRQCLWTSCW